MAIGKELKIHFIVGTSRGGTTWMTKNLNCHPDIASFGETLYWGRSYIEPENNNEYSDDQLKLIAKIYSDRKIAPRSSGRGNLNVNTIEKWPAEIGNIILQSQERTPLGIFRAMCNYIAQHESKSVVVEKTPHHINWVDRIVKNFPNAKFIAMLRDPYDFMLSYKYQGSQGSESTRNLFEKIYHPILVSIIWRGYVRSINNALRKHGDKIFLVKTTDIANADAGFFKKLFDHLEVEDISREFMPIEKANSSFTTLEKPKLSSVDIFWMNLISGKEILQAGIELEAYKLNILAIILSILILPVWAIRYLFIVRNRFEGGFFKYMIRWLK